MEQKRTLFDFQKEVHKLACEKGWHAKPCENGTAIALMHSELSEALEWDRCGNHMSDHIPEFLGMEEELADVIIRILDFAEEKKLDVLGAMTAKHKFNGGRPHNHGGKKY